MHIRPTRLTFMFCLALSLSGCKTMYFGVMEKFGFEKRDLLIDRVEDARDGQEAAKQQFSSALEEFSKVLGFQGGDLETKYNKLNAELKRCESRAQDVNARVDDVEYVAKALFKEWKAENKQYTNAEYRRSSERQLAAAEVRYEELIAAMHKAEDRMNPVLNAFRDQVLFLKHNLNSRAIAAIQERLVSVETDIDVLIREMEASIAEANIFIEAMMNEG